MNIRRHLTYANVMVTILAFVVIGGGTALASYVISSNSQVGPGTISGHQPPSGKHANIIANSINGKDIADRSGVDTCRAPLVKKFGPICAGSDGGTRDFYSAIFYCSALGLRLPTLSEAVTLAKNYDVPGVGATGHFWADDEFVKSNDYRATIVYPNGAIEDASLGGANATTVCVTDPSA